MRFFSILICAMFLINNAHPQQKIKDLTVNDFKVISSTRASIPCPKMTEIQRDLLITPIDGQCVYNETTSKLNVYNGSIWKAAGGGVDSWQSGFSYSVNDLVIDSLKIYRATSSHVSTVFVTDLSNSKWEEIASNDDAISASEENKKAINILSSTGLTSGGDISINAVNTKFDISAGSGVVVDSTIPSAPVATRVEWEAINGTTPSLIGSRDYNYIYINSAGAVFQSNLTPTQESRRDRILIGRVDHVNKTNINRTYSTAEILSNPSNQFYDLLDAIGPFKISGNEIVAVDEDLTITRLEGKIFTKSYNSTFERKKPHEVVLDEATIASFKYASSLDFLNVATSFIKPEFYDNAGVITPNSGDGTRASIQRIFLFPTGEMRIQYGPKFYDSLNQAVQAINSEVFVMNKGFEKIAIEIAKIVITSECESLMDSKCSMIINNPKIGSASPSGTTSLAQAYNNSTPPQIVTNASSGAVVLKSHGTGTQDVLKINNSSSVNTFNVKANGSTTIESKVISDNSDNGNLTRNYSFDYADGMTGWSCTGTATSISGNANTTNGLKVLKHETSAIGQNCSQTIFAQTSLIGKVFTFSVDAQASTDNHQICLVEGGVEKVCKDIEISVKPEKVSIVYNVTNALVGLKIKAKTATATTLYVDNVYFGRTPDNGLLLNVKNSSKWEDVALTITNNTNFTKTKTKMMRSGSMMYLDIVLTWTGAGLVGAPVIEIPNSLTTNVHIASAMQLASARLLDEGNATYALSVITNSSTSIRLNRVANIGIGGIIQDGNLPFTPGNLDVMTVFVAIPIAEWQDTFQAAGTLCQGGALKCSNVFSAYGDYLGGFEAPVMPFISTIALTDTSLYTVNFTSGTFTVPPLCLVSIQSSGTTLTRVATISETTKDKVVIRTGVANVSGTFTKQPENYHFTCTKIKPDYNAEIEKWMPMPNNVAKTIGTEDRVDVFGVKFTKTGGGNCDSSPCAIESQTGDAVTSVTRSGVGAYTINTKRSYKKLNCSFNALINLVGAGSVFTATAAPPMTLISVSVGNYLNASADAIVSGTCIGAY